MFFYLNFALMRKNLLKQIIVLIVLSAVFVVMSYLAHAFKAQLADIVQFGGVLGIFGFVLLTAVFVVFIRGAAYACFR